jgi:hypothetical protein
MSHSSPTTPAADARSRALAAANAQFAAAAARRLALETLEAIVADATPDVPAGLERRVLLADVIARLADDRQLTLPKTPAAWDDGRPALPRWLTVTRPAARSPAARRRRHPWHRDLVWASTMALTDAQYDALQRIQNWIVNRPADDPRSYVRERSVDIFADDKRLESLMGAALFAPGRLTLELLDCEVVYQPLAVTRLRPDGSWLVVENATTYRRLASTPDAIPEAALLVYGAGGQAAAGLPGLLSDHPRPPSVQWFGDIDRDGLRIAISASAALAAEGLDVAPHQALYRALMARAISAPSIVPPTTPAEATALARWLDDAYLSAFAAEILVSGRRAMQEQVGPRELGRPDAYA